MRNLCHWTQIHHIFSTRGIIFVCNTRFLRWEELHFFATFNFPEERNGTFLQHLKKYRILRENIRPLIIICRILREIFVLGQQLLKSPGAGLENLVRFLLKNSFFQSIVIAKKKNLRGDSFAGIFSVLERKIIVFFRREELHCFATVDFYDERNCTFLQHSIFPKRGTILFCKVKKSVVFYDKISEMTKCCKKIRFLSIGKTTKLPKPFKK